MRRGPVLIAALVLAACSDKQTVEKFDTTLTIQEVMKHVIDPAAVALWGRAGSMSDGVTEKSLAPTDEATWRQAENEAATVAEGGNLLLVPGRVLKVNEADTLWPKLVGDMTREALAVKAATQARDTQKMFDAGGRLYDACTACHKVYYEPFLDSDGAVKPNAPSRKKQ